MNAVLLALLALLMLLVVALYVIIQIITSHAFWIFIGIIALYVLIDRNL